MAMIWAFCRDETGATAIEYALIGGLLSILIAAGATTIGTKMRNDYFLPVSNVIT